MKSFIFAFAILIGTIVGAGIFGLPYVVSKSGMIPGFFYFFILGGAILLLHLIFGEIVLRTNGDCRIVGYAQKYLGDNAKILVVFSTIVGLVGSLLAYGIIAGNFLKIIFTSIPVIGFGISAFSFTVIFFILLSFFLFRGLKTIAPTEIFTNVIFFAIILIIFFFGIPKINLENINISQSGNLFLPFGVIMFSLVGWTAIPEMKEMLKTKKEKRSLKKIITVGTVFCALLYLFFSFIVFGISGKDTSQDALAGLVPFLGQKIILFGAIAAVFTLVDSFLIIGLSLKNTLVYDLKIPGILASFITCGLPLILFLAGLNSFIGIIGFAGTVLGAIDGIVILMIYKRAKKNSEREPEYSLHIPGALIYGLGFIFLAGAVVQILFNT
jgi:amino acid permease